MAENAYMGKGRAKMWTYLFVAVGLLVVAILINLFIKSPGEFKDGFKHFLGLPSWLLATIAFVVGAGVFYLGLKVETDWPEFVGAALITGSLFTFELFIGWKKVAMGLIVLPYVIPIAVFVLLMVIGMKKSV
jgi:hypothetical protein